MGLGLTTIAQINGIAGVVFTVARRGTDFGPGLGILLTLGLDIEKNRFLFIMGAVAREGN
jgi:hypothetical protein